MRRAATIASPAAIPHSSIPHIAENYIASYNILTIWNLSTRTAAKPLLIIGSISSSPQFDLHSDRALGDAISRRRLSRPHLVNDICGGECVQHLIQPLGSHIHGQRPALAAALFCPPPCAPVRDRALPAPLPRPPSGAGEVDPTFFVAAGERGGPNLTRLRHLFRGVAIGKGVLAPKIEFAADSSLERTGFELVVPLRDC